MFLGFSVRSYASFEQLLVSSSETSDFLKSPNEKEVSGMKCVTEYSRYMSYM